MTPIHFLLLLIGSVFANSEDNFAAKFYGNTFPQAYECSVSFDQPMPFNCACIRGLWILYESCYENITIAGGNSPRCMPLIGTPIAKAVQVVRNHEELAIITPNGEVTLLQPGKLENVEIYNNWALVSGSDWTLVDTFGTRICLSITEPSSYCFFGSLENSKLELIAVERGCDTYDYFWDPLKCETVGGQDENLCESMDLKKHSVVKRDATAPAAKPENAGNSSDSESAITEEDEDYLIAQLTANKTENKTSDPTVWIANGILEFMDGILDELLGFHENPPPAEVPAGTIETTTVSVSGGDATRIKKSIYSRDVGSGEDLTNSSNLNPLNVTYSNPAYEFLEISKRIIQKTCPSFYVKPQFLNLAISTFIRLQQVQFKFPETSFKPAGFRRVLEYLRNCEQYASNFNFTRADCEGNVDGNYSAYGATNELTVTTETANFARDPIVETVWKVFFNAHSYCYQFFTKTLDHHRFTAWMIPLFQNQINDIWTSGKTTAQSLNGLFGNQVRVQGNLAYCAASSRLESSYPFDLPRPARVAEFGPSLFGNGTRSNKTKSKTKAGAKTRAKRELGVLKLFISSGTCLDSSKPMLCPDHVKSIVQSY